MIYDLLLSLFFWPPELTRLIHKFEFGLRLISLASSGFYNFIQLVLLIASSFAH